MAIVITEIKKDIPGSPKVTGVKVMVDSAAETYVDLSDLALTGVKALDKQNAINAIISAATTFRNNGFNLYSLDELSGQDITAMGSL